MGIFDGFKVAKDIIQGGIETAKACEALDEAVKKSITEYESRLTSTDKELYLNYKVLCDKEEKLTDMDAKNQMSEEIEAAEIAYLTSLLSNIAIATAFKSEIKAAIAHYNTANAEAMERVKKRMLSMAKTEEERAQLLKDFESVK